MAKLMSYKPYSSQSNPKSNGAIKLRVGVPMKDGFAQFVKAFPLNSNLTAHFSRAILSVTENHEFMEMIEKKYFGKSIEVLQQQSVQISSASPSLTFQFTALQEYSQRWFLNSPPSTEICVHPNYLHSTEGTDRPSLPRSI
ncbi:hypothetical protein TSUD_189380 [Trifolium subterraneum]|uniref:Uncharacterized protein n=1 Tax=Trifolium subterraneum TaxID=3900 RepID=A0A2Z6LQN2_TRISU|nr:hypothetical protein TSUD_189380 [Trifolium subterraneum]